MNIKDLAAVVGYAINQVESSAGEIEILDNHEEQLDLLKCLAADCKQVATISKCTCSNKEEVELVARCELIDLLVDATRSTFHKHLTFRDYYEKHTASYPTLDIELYQWAYDILQE